MAIDFTNPEPLYKQVAEDIRSKIARGELKEGDQLEPQEILAQKYGVSMITIKKAIGDLSNEGLLLTRAGKGTFVSRKSRGVDFAKHKTIGIVLRDFNSPYFSLIMQAVEEKASSMGINVLLSSSSNRAEKEESMINHYLEIGVGGLIIASMARIYHATPIIRKLHDEGFPYIMVSYIDDEDIYFVGTDNEEGGYLAGVHLAKLGYRKIGYINGEVGNVVGEKRKKGFVKALEEFGIEFDSKFEFHLRLRGEWNDYQSGYEIGEYFIGLSEKPEAMFVYNDLSALGFQRALIERGIRVPEDVAIVGFDDIKRGVVAPVPLTTIHQPTDKIGEKAFEILLMRMDGKEVPVRTILSPYVVVRESCGANLKSS
ncbi:MAG: GntR family transcriptional regulator [Candidatus Marinimicrobia bacterium]|nr:GntR family transcriptional regulator [Candidatus Neomarinimicrobiota bacterium]